MGEIVAAMAACRAPQLFTSPQVRALMALPGVHRKMKQMKHELETQ